MKQCQRMNPPHANCLKEKPQEANRPQQRVILAPNAGWSM